MTFEMVMRGLPLLVLLLGILAFLVWVPVQIRRNRLRRVKGK